MFVLRSVRLLVRALTAESSHRQIAAGIALGMLVGLVPKGNLLAVSLLMLVSCFRVSLPAIFFSAFVCSWLGLLVDDLADAIGEQILTAPALRPFWVWLYEQPGLPWTNFNNTLVIGSLLLGLLLVYPVYRISLPVVARCEPPLNRWAKRYRLGRWLLGAEWAECLRSAA